MQTTIARAARRLAGMPRSSFLVPGAAALGAAIFFAWKPGVAVSAIASAFVGPTRDRSDPDGGTRLNRLRGSRGNQNYSVPADVQLGRPPTVLIWCRPFTVPVAAATLR